MIKLKHWINRKKKNFKKKLIDFTFPDNLDAKGYPVCFDKLYHSTKVYNFKKIDIENAPECKHSFLNNKN